MTAERDKLEAPLFTLEVPKELTKPIKPTIKRGWGRLWKYPVNENPVMENYMTSAGISTKQSLYMDILVLVQEALFMDLWCKEINKLFKKGVFAVIMERDVL